MYIQKYYLFIQAQGSGMSSAEIDSLMELYNDIRHELLEEEAIWALEEEEVVDETDFNQETSVPCPNCAKPIYDYKELDAVSLVKSSKVG